MPLFFWPDHKEDMPKIAALACHIDPPGDTVQRRAKTIPRLRGWTKLEILSKVW